MTLQRIRDEGPRPDPVIHPDTEPFWTGLARGELLAQVCTQCGAYRYPFAPVCFRCRSFDLTWKPVATVGTVASAVVVHRATGDPQWAAHLPYASGIVDLEHGLRLPGRILCSCGAGLRRGAAVRVVVLEGTGRARVHAFAHSCVAAEAS